MAFEVEGRDAVGGLCAAVAVDAGEGGIDAVLDAYALGEADLDAAEAAVDADDCTVAQVGIAQVEAREAEADVHVGPLERLAVVAVFLLAEGYVDLVQLAAVEDDGDGLFRDALTVAALLVVEKDERNTPHDGYEAEHILPDVVPRDDAAGGQKQQDADAAPDDGAGLVAVAEDVDEAGDDDEEGPPAFEADADDVEELQGPYDAEGHEGNAADDFACAFHFIDDLLFKLFCYHLFNWTVQWACELAATVPCKPQLRIAARRLHTAAAPLYLLHRQPYQLRGNSLSPQTVVDIGVVDDINAVALRVLWPATLWSERHFPHFLAVHDGGYPVLICDVFHKSEK